MGNIFSKYCCCCCSRIKREIQRDRQVEVIYKEITSDPMGFDTTII